MSQGEDTASDAGNQMDGQTIGQRNPAEGPVTDLSPAEVRVLGCLIEKSKTTPDNYPLTVNSLRNACNQSTSRNPVVDYTEREVEVALDALKPRRLRKLVHTSGGRVMKYRHWADERFGLDDAQLAALAVIMLRGPQTVGEVKQRTGRMHTFASMGDAADVVQQLAEGGLVVQLEREPGKKDSRWAHTLSGDPTAGGDAGGSGVAGDVPRGGPFALPEPVERSGVTIREYAEPDRAEVIDVWRQSGLLQPTNDPNQDIDRKVAHGGGLLVAIAGKGSLVGTAMAGYDGHRGRLNYVGVLPEAERQGIGRALVDVAAEHLVSLGCPKINIQIRETNTAVIDFYETVGYSLDPVISMERRLGSD